MNNAITAKTSFTSPQVGRIGWAALAHLARAAFWAADRFVSHSRQRQAMAILMAMDDRQLKDLGVSRGAIPAYVTGRFGSYGRDGS